MRNELIVSFFLCIGLTSGYIVPSSITELKERKRAENYLEEIDLATTEGENLISFETKLPNPLSKANLENAKNNINESEILSQGASKPNKINERSFIFIRQKFKTPMLNLFHSQMQNPNEILHDLPKSLMTSSDNAHFEELSQRFSTLNIVTPAKGNSETDKMYKVLDKTQGTLLTHLCTNKVKIQNDDKTSNKTVDSKIQDASKVSNDQREFLELLKAPLLRPNYRGENIKPVVQENESRRSEVSKAPPYVRNHNTISKISLDLRQRLVKKYNTEYSRPYESQLTFYKSELANQQEERDSTFVFDDIVGTKVIDENTDDEQGWDQYLKNTLEGKLEERKKPTHNHINRIHYCHDCIMKNVNQDSYNRLRLDSDCKCGRHVYLRGRSDWNDQDKQIKLVSMSPFDKKLVTVVLDGTENIEADKTIIDPAKEKQSLFN